MDEKEKDNASCGEESCKENLMQGLLAVLAEEEARAWQKRQQAEQDKAQ